MYRCYNLIVKDNLPKKELEYDKKFDIAKTKFQKNIQSFITDEKTLDAKKIIDNWFPEINADIFISHSHADLDYISRLTSLFKNLGLRTFVDSDVWGYSDELLKNLDDEYCYKKERGTYDYKTRNKTTSCVHMMLSSALAYMIDKCECIIFVNTPNSIVPSSYIKKEKKTYSPWLYNEMVLSQLIRVRTKKEHRTQLIAEDSELQKKQALNFLAEFPAKSTHMTSITDKNLSFLSAVSSSHKKKGHQALDLLYTLFPQK